jgi:hypothetical protein
MGNLLSYLAAVFFAVWLIGFMILHLGALIHLFLVMAFVSALIRFIQWRRFIRRVRM